MFVAAFGPFAWAVSFASQHTYSRSIYFYWDGIPARRLRPETLDRAAALEKAKAVARAAREGTGVAQTLTFCVSY
jgi:hypothetical protein